MADLIQAQAAPAAVAVRQLAAGEANQYLTFTLAGEMFAIGILNIKEIIEYGSLTDIPMMPSHIRGVINLRGAVVPVIDLAARFGHPASAVQRRSCIVIVEVKQEEDIHHLGIMVDAVSEVLEIPGADIESPPAFGAKIRADFIAGMGKVGGRFVIILDILHVLSIDETVMLAAMDAPAA